MASAATRLEQRAFAQQQVLVDSAIRSAGELQGLMVRVGEEMHSRSTKDEAEAVRRYVAELHELGKHWPALADASPDQLAQLNQVYDRFRGDISGEAHRTSYPVGTFRLTDPWKNPRDGITFFQGYCDDQLIGAVARSARSVTESAKLRAVLGEKYDSYYKTLQERVERTREAQLAAQRQQQAEAARERAEERRMEESHPVEEHPVEIP